VENMHRITYKVGGAVGAMTTNTDKLNMFKQTNTSNKQANKETNKQTNK
jgi:hypothetical protein